MSSSDLSSKAIAEVVPELYREIITMDESFALYRPPIKADEKPAGDSSHYVKCRKLLLTNKLKAKELSARKPTDRRGDYLLLREQLLNTYYPQRNKTLNPANADNAKKDRKSDTPKKTPLKMDPVVGTQKVNEAYAFAGMHHIFAHHTSTVTTVKFANKSKDLFAMASQDRTVSIASLLSDPPRVLLSLFGHTDAVLDIDWSQLNDSLASVSSDKTLRIWDTKTGKLIRTITDDAPIHCCRFHPENNNAIITGNARGVLKVYNSSTGKLLQTISTGAVVKCITFNTRGDVMFLGDSEGFVRWYEYDLVEFHWRGQKKVIEAKGKSINSISFREFHTAMSSAEWPAVLISATDNSMRLFRVVDTNNLEATDNLSKTSLSLEPRSHFIVKNQTANVRSCFCPAISQRTVGCIVSGSEPGGVLIVAYPALLTGNQPITPRDKNNKPEPSLPASEAGEPMTLVNQLQGHGTTVTAVDWDYDESLLATADASGLVIIWKTKKNVPKSP